MVKTSWPCVTGDLNKLHWATAWCKAFGLSYTMCSSTLPGKTCHTILAGMFEATFTQPLSLLIKIQFQDTPLGKFWARVIVQSMKMFSQRHYRCCHGRRFGSQNLKLVRAGRTTQPEHPQRQNITPGCIRAFVGQWRLERCSRIQQPGLLLRGCPHTHPLSHGGAVGSWGHLGSWVWTPGLGVGSDTGQNIDRDQGGLLPLLFCHRSKPKCQIHEFYKMLCSSLFGEHIQLSHQIQHLYGLATF